MSKFVLDCSVVAAWFFPDESSGYADPVMESLDTNQPVAPSLLLREFLNALVSAERRGRITQADTARFAADLAEIGVETDSGEGVETEALLRLARDHNLSIYDASYLELAERRGLPIASLDERVKSAAAQSGIAVYQP